MQLTAIWAGALVALWLILDFALPHIISTSETSTGHWQTPFPVVVLGLIEGASYGLLAAGLVLIYRSNRIINFAHGEVGAFAASFFAIEVTTWHMPYWVALLPALIVAALIGVLIDNGVIRRLRNAPAVMSVVATLIAGEALSGFAQVINSHAISGVVTIPEPPGLPTFRIGALLVTQSYVAILIIAPIAVIAVGLFLKFSRTGRGIRAASDNSDAARMAGIPVNVMSSIAWAIAGGLAALTAILTAPSAGSGGGGFGPSLLLIALTGAVLARMRSLPGAMVGGLAIGVLEQLLAWNSQNGGIVEMALFVIIVVALLVQRQPIGRGEDKGSWSVIKPSRPIPAAVRALPSVKVLERAPWLVLFAILASLPLLVDNGTSQSLTVTVSFTIVALALGVVTGLGGQLSLGQFAMSAVGAYASWEIARRTGNYVESFAYAAGAGALLSVLLGLPAVKARGLMFAVTTLAFGLVVPDFLLGEHWVLGAGQIPGRPIIDGHAIRSGHAYYYFALVILLIALWFARNARRGGLGRRLIAVRDNEDAARSFSISATWTKVQCYALAGALTGLAGAMYGHSLSQIGYDGWPVSASLGVVQIAVVGGLGALSGPIWGAALVTGPTYAASIGALGSTLLLDLYLVIVLYLPGGVVQIPLALRNRVAAWLAGRAGIDYAAAAAAERGITEATTEARAIPDFARPLHRRVTGSGALLDVRDLKVSFGGVHAVRGMSFQVREGETLGLIGPNGAGKTTTFELIAGFVRPDGGSVRFRDSDITRLSPEARARRGLIRSFQDAALFPTLTVADCVALALERTAPTSVTLAALGIRPGERRKQSDAQELLDWMGLSRFRSSVVGELSTGTRRITEIACLVALQPELLLLDEPSSGVAQRETEALAELLARLRHELSLTMVVIEHDMPLIMGLSDRIVCMADGEEIAIGTPEQVQRHPAVITAYLGGAIPEAVAAGAAR
jgi:ABC-type branched-subunit amino acid transport system ATPase component/ABC-type branched-subunit amino acid transport system permease subunit